MALYSVIVPAYNPGRALKECLGGLENQSIPQEHYEVIVVDDGSTDDASRIAEGFKVKYIFQTNQGADISRL